MGISQYPYSFLAHSLQHFVLLFSQDPCSPSANPFKTKMPHRQNQIPPAATNDFDCLVQRINNILGPANGINSENVNVKDLEDAMRDYASSEADWQRYAFADKSRNYSRNLVDRGNGKTNLLILVWTPGKGSPIHDHTDAHCVMKVLKGSLEETLFAWPCETESHPSICASHLASAKPSTKHTCSASKATSRPTALKSIRKTTYQTDEVTYMSDMLGLHRIRNPSDTEFAVSLHLYTPPNAAIHRCNIFDEQTGKRHHVQQCGYYSEMGARVVTGVESA